MKLSLPRENKEEEHTPAKKRIGLITFIFNKTPV